MSNIVTAKWTGSFPNLCSGEWIIHVDAIRLVNIGNDNFETFGSYENVYLEGWHEFSETYDDGLMFDEWKNSNVNGIMDSLRLHGITSTDELMLSIYDAVSACDWRSSSCGGCI